MNKQKELLDIFKSALNAVEPYYALLRFVCVEENQLIANSTAYNLKKIKRIIVIGAGKAAAPMSQAVEKILEDKLDDSIIIVKYGHAKPLRRIKQIEAGHPIPDANGMKGTKKIIELLKGVDKNTLVICLFSGGASSLLVSPLDGITFKDKKRLTSLLLSAGANIEELNAVRKHISAIKGGRLAELAAPAKVITMVLSDVIGNRLDVIASGPTVPDTTTFKDAIMVIEKYGLEKKIPLSVKRVLQDGINGKNKETPKGKEGFFRNVQNIIIGSIEDAIDAAYKRAFKSGFELEIITSKLCGEAVDAAQYLAAKAIEVQNSMGKGDKPRCLISGGETTVVVKGNGVGGRNQELALAFAVEIAGTKGITMLSAGTDGTDGPTDAAGAVVDGDTILLAKKLGINPETYLANNDSYNFFKRLDSMSNKGYHLKTGPTGTNVMDIQLIFVGV